MGSTIVRAAAATLTGGASELARKKPGQPGGGTDLKGAALSTITGPYGAGAQAAAGTKIDTPLKSEPITEAVVKPWQTDEEREREARIAREKRRKSFENLGRSGTIMTGPGGLTGQGPGTQKSLLGY